MAIVPINNTENFYLRRTRQNKKSTNQDKVKAAVGSVLGTAIPLALMMKRQGVGVFKLKYNLGDMIVLSGSSIVGGVGVGMIGNDAETNWGKSREGVFQFLNAAFQPGYQVQH